MLRIIFKILVGIIIAVTIWNIFKPLPAGVSVSGQQYNVSDASVEFLADRTYVDANGNRVLDHEIFDEIFRMIQNAQTYILVDMFLFNDFKGDGFDDLEPLSQQLTDALIAKKQSNPEIVIQFITDPINVIYGAQESKHITALQEAGIVVIETDVKALRDSNPLYSGLWRSVLQFVPRGFISLANPFDSRLEKVDLATYLTLLNFKANHRKVILTDYRLSDGNLNMSTLMTSANPHDGSSAHGNIAIKVDGEMWRDVVQSEKSVALFSGAEFIEPLGVYTNAKGSDETSDSFAQILTEGKIKRELLRSFKQTQSGDRIQMVMFYLSDRDIVSALEDAQARGVEVQLILDPNKDAFGREKNGIPNVSVARELFDSKDPEEQVAIRWCDTHGEQCHSKLILVTRGSSIEMYAGSANLTRRNIGNYNLEANIKITDSGKDEAILDAIREAQVYFEQLWTNEKQYTVDYSLYQDASLRKYWQYRIMEMTGLSSF